MQRKFAEISKITRISAIKLRTFASDEKASKFRCFYCSNVGESFASKVINRNEIWRHEAKFRCEILCPLDEIAEPLSKNTARIQLDGWHLLFKEYLPDYWSIPLYTTPKLSRNTGANEDRHLKCTSIELSIFSLFEGFFLRNYFEGIMKRLSDSVLVIILQIILSLIQ